MSALVRALAGEYKKLLLAMLQRREAWQIIDFVNQQTSIPQLPGLELRTLPLGEHLGKFDLTLNVEVGEHGLGAALQYNADLFDNGCLERWYTAEQLESDLARRAFCLPSRSGDTAVRA